jgi:hypothetical protein
MRFVAAFVAAAAGLSAVLVGLAWLVDPRDDFGTGLFPVVVSDARREKVERFVSYDRERPVQGIVLGSSRSMKLAPRSLEAVFGLRFFNFSVDSARAEDYLALYRWTRRQGGSIRLVIVGLDVEALHDDDTPDATLQSNAALRTALEGRQLGWNERLMQIVRRYKAVFTTAYVSDIAWAVRLELSRAPGEARAAVFEADGYLRYPRWEGQRAAGTFDLEREIERCLPKYRRRFEGMTHLSSRRRQELQTLIAEARGDGARVIVWLTGIHPRTARYLETRTRYGALLGEVREYLGELHRSLGVDVRDYSEPSAYGGTLSGWYDCGHIDEIDASRVAASLARDAS